MSIPSQQPQSRTNSLLVIAVAALAAVLAFQAWTSIRPDIGDSEFAPRSITPSGELGAAEARRVEVFRQTSPSVVFIRTKGFRPVLIGGSREQELSSGTGFVWDEDGHIVTNLHVVEDKLNSPNAELEVKFADGSLFDASVIGGDHRNDIAILKVNASSRKLQPILLGTSADLQVGQSVLAIGNPFGFDQTLSTGVIGGLNRIVGRSDSNDSLAGLVQTDAAINPGNSGGPLLDASGRVIGMNTAIVSPTGAYAGLGFAVPIDAIVASVNSVLSGENVDVRPILGIYVIPKQGVQMLTNDYGLDPDIANRGVLFFNIDPDSSAARAGLKPTVQRGSYIYLGDQILSIDERPTRNMEDLLEILDGYSAGDEVTLKVVRGRQERFVKITLEAPKRWANE